MSFNNQLRMMLFQSNECGHLDVLSVFFLMETEIKQVLCDDVFLKVTEHGIEAECI